MGRKSARGQSARAAQGNEHGPKKPHPKQSREFSRLAGVCLGGEVLGQPVKRGPRSRINTLSAGRAAWIRVPTPPCKKQIFFLSSAFEVANHGFWSRAAMFTQH